LRKWLWDFEKMVCRKIVFVKWDWEKILLVFRKIVFGKWDFEKLVFTKIVFEK